MLIPAAVDCALLIWAFLVYWYISITMALQFAVTDKIPLFSFPAGHRPHPENNRIISPESYDANVATFR